MDENVTVINHPLIAHKLTLMRRKNSSTQKFRSLLREVAHLLTYEITRDLELTTEVIETPYGFHVIQLVEKRPGQQRELGQVKESIRAQLKRRAIEDAVTRYRESLQTMAKIEIDQDALECLAESLPPPDPRAQVSGGH